MGLLPAWTVTTPTLRLSVGVLQRCRTQDRSPRCPSLSAARLVWARTLARAQLLLNQLLLNQLLLNQLLNLCLLLVLLSPAQPPQHLPLLLSV